MAEVSYRALGLLFEVVRQRRLEPDPLLEGLPLDAADASRIRGGFEWSTFAVLVRRTCDLLGGSDELERGVYALSDTPPPSWLRPVVRALVRPRDLMWMGARWMGRSLWPITTAVFEDLSRTHVRETIGIPDGYEDLPEFFFAMRGAIRSGPRVLGYEDARVEMEIEPRRAIYTIELPTRRVAPGGARAPADEILKAIDEMGAQLDELQATQAALREANLELEARVRERTHELLVSRARLEESHRLAALGTLAAGIAHEINNPLAAIQATAQLAQVTLRRDPGTRLEEAPLALIVDEARRGSRIVRGLLQFARGEAAEKWRIDMRTVVDRVVELARPHAHEAGVRIGVEPIDAVLPVVGNPIQLEQAVLHVLHNAIDASPITGVITVRAERLADVVRTSVVDRGRGIPEKDVPHIFDPFFTTRLDEGGTGLGLSTAHGILDQHGGRIEVESEVGVGTTVHLDLPLDRSGD